MDQVGGVSYEKRVKQSGAFEDFDQCLLPLDHLISHALHFSPEDTHCMAKLPSRDRSVECAIVSSFTLCSLKSIGEVKHIYK